MERCRLLTVGALLLLVPVITASAFSSDNDKEPSPEPYSFSYQAESVGGFSSHQESGDGTGKVQGFYIIMGEDGRDRRVDYVADENGYRASISTNEVGTRSESSADAQYNARLPSQGQLNQAKVTAEEYQYLEEQHAAERERQLASANSKRQQQQQQFNFSPDRQLQQQWTSSSGQYQSPGSQSNGSRVWATNQQGASWNQQPQQSLYEQSNSTLSNEQNSADDAWRRSAKLFGGNQQQQYAAANQWSAPASAQSNSDQQRFSSSSSSSWSNQTGELRQQQPFGSLASATTIGPLAAALANAPAPAPAPQRQQAQQAAWQLADRGAAPARLPISGNNNYLQRALEQQFMQQAYQLTDQDYPRQPINNQFDNNNNNNNNNRQGGSVDYTSNGQLLTQQRPQVFANQVNVQQQAQQPQRYDNEQRGNFSSIMSAVGYTQQQRPNWQTGTYNNNNNNNLVLASSGGESSQINQQQNNIIDEVSGEQVDTQVTNISDDSSKSTINANGNFFNSTSSQFSQGGLKQQNNYAQQQQQQQQYEEKQPQFVQPITTTTTSRPAAPNGFIAINLGLENSTSSIQNQQLDQEVESKQPQQQQSFVTNTQSTSSFSGQKTNQDQNTGDYQQVTVQQQVSNPTKQVVEITNQQQEGGSYVDSNRGKQQVATTFQSVPELRPDTTTTTQRPYEASTVAVQQQKTQQQVVESSQAPLAEISTTIASQRPTIFQQYVTSTSTAPSRVPYDTSTVDTLMTTNIGGSSSFFQQTSKRPTTTNVQYQQTVDVGVKGGRRVGGQREFNSTFYNRFNEQPAVVTGQRQQQVIVSEQQQQQQEQQRPTSESAQANTTSPGVYQQSTLTSERPEVITGNRFAVEQTNKQSEYNRLPAQQQVPYQRPIATSFEYNNRQQQRVTDGEIGATNATLAPIPFIATGPQQQFKGGVKGGSKTGKRQFWLQQQPSVPSAQRVFQTSATRQPVEIAPSQPSGDYAASVTSYGSRISGR